MSVLLNAIVCFWNFLSSFLPPIFVSVFQSLEICWLCSSFSTCHLSFQSICSSGLQPILHLWHWKTSIAKRTLPGGDPPCWFSAFQMLKKTPWNAGFVFFLTEESHRFEGSFTSNTAELILTSYEKNQVCPSVQSLEKLSYPL